MRNSILTESSATHPNIAWLFDIDGVLTDPEAKYVTQSKIFDELIKRLGKSEPVGLNTGRSLSSITTQILDPLETKIKDRSLLKNIIAIGEKGGAWLTYNNEERTTNINSSIRVPQIIQDQIRKLVSQPNYSNIVFYDETKITMVTVELKPFRTITEFKGPQQNLTFALQNLLNKHHLENDYRVDPTRIAVDVESKNAGKALGARKYSELLTERGIDPVEFISFGDSASDYKMFEELTLLGKKSHFVFVGGKENLTNKDLTSVTFTKQNVDKGTLEYLQSH